MTDNPRSSIEWLANKIRYEQNREELRNIALLLVLALEDGDVVDQYFGKEMAEEGFYDNYEDEPYDDGSAWLGDDKEAFDIATGMTIGHIKGVIGK